MSNIITEYIQLTQEYQSKYGNRTILLMQVGAFYEVYGLKDSCANISKSEIVEFSQVCSLNIASKSSTYLDQQVVMAGFRDYTLEKYLQKLTDAGFTTVVYGQEKDGKNITRKLQAIYSQGTYISFDTEQLAQITNNIVCIWAERIPGTIPGTMTSKIRQESIVIGCACINIFTGKSSIFEYQTLYNINPTTFDELSRFISICLPSEVIIISNFQETQVNTILQYSGIQTSNVHRVNIQDPSNIKVQNCAKQKYIQHILAQFYGEETFDQCSEFSMNPIAVQAFCYLLNFIQEHNPNLVRKIDLPTFNNTSDRLILANHTLKQLNIIDDRSNDGKSCGHLSSVLAFLNRCCSPMGKRLFQTQLLNPTFAESWLNKEYQMIETMLCQGKPVLGHFRKQISRIHDLEKISRQLIIRKIYPSSIYNLYSSVQQTQQLNVCLYENKDIVEYLVNVSSVGELNISQVSTNQSNLYIDKLCLNILEFIESQLKIQDCKLISSIQSFDENIIMSGVSPKLDQILEKHNMNNQNFKNIHSYLNKLFQTNDTTSNQTLTGGQPLTGCQPLTGGQLHGSQLHNSQLHSNQLHSNQLHSSQLHNNQLHSSQDIEYIKIHETEKSGQSLQITKKRSQTLKQILLNLGKTTDRLDISETIKIKISDIKFTNASTANDEIDIPILVKVSKDILQSKDELNREIATAYNSFLDKLETQCFQDIEKISNYIAKFDVLVCKSYLAIEYKYCKPEIIQETTCVQTASNTAGITASNTSGITVQAQVQITELRHVLIEHIQQNEIYVPNDIQFDQSNKGILLYGTNAVGKTSLIRALGIAVIMAQAGMFVPCTKFIYKPYTAIFSRILGNDNIFKGLSTFAVEMSELRVILKQSDENSLILGDELCSGTETESALSIFMAGLMELDKKRASFIFATHFHEIMKYDEMQELSKIRIMHMAVHYDRELDCLVYDRKLRDGPGNRMYGLEVCKSLYLPEDFLEKAYKIRNKYNPEMKGGLEHPTSSYNSQKIRGLCELCKVELSQETHHIAEQHTAGQDGYIGTFHKNHKANLMALCESCHHKQHDNRDEPIKNPVKCKTTKGILVLNKLYKS